jgi:hypothetical protein
MMRRLFARKASPATGGTNRVFLAAFGKHPGWNDHIEDLGVETDLLVRLKRTLYLEGISGNVDSGAWEKLSEGQRLERFDHGFLWRTSGDIVVGRMWSSMDGKGRTRYPMVVCAHCSGLPLPWVLQQVLPRLEEIRTRCVNTTSSLAVKSILDDMRRQLRELAPRGEGSPRSGGMDRTTKDTKGEWGPGIWEEDPGRLSPLAVLARSPEMGRDHVGLLRVLYKIEQGMPADDARGAEPATRVVQGSLHVRVPACADSPSNTIRLWLSFLLEEFDSSNAMILLLPLGEPWIDIIVGQPSAKEFYCMRASLDAVPRTTDIPYTLAPGFLERMERRIAASVGARATPLTGDR